jgi:hypothetical protein
MGLPGEDAEYTHPSIPVGHMTDLVGRSGLAPAYRETVIDTLREAADGMRGLVSPANVVDAGMRLGVGYLVGKPAMKLLGKTLGAVAGLPRSSQEKLTTWGTLGIMLANTLLGR